MRSLPNDSVFVARGENSQGGSRKGLSIAVLFALAGALFFARGIYRGLQNGYDFATPYAGSIAWVNGQNPYDKAVLAQVLRAAGREVRNDGGVDFTEPVYPTTVFLLLSPLSGLTWTQARAVWLGLSLLLYLAAAWASWRRVI